LSRAGLKNRSWECVKLLYLTRELRDMKKGRNQKNFPDERGEGDKKQRDGKLKDGCRMERDDTYKT